MGLPSKALIGIMIRDTIEVARIDLADELAL
jgi:hypothetical protein